MKKSFTYKLLGAGPNKRFPYIEVPFDTVKAFGSRGRVPVKVTVRGVELRMSLAPMGGKHVLGFSGALAEKADIKVGDTVRVTVEKDDAPRTVDVPPDLAHALKSNAHARKAWDALSYTHRREHARAIAEAKRPETRARRVQKTLEMLTTTGRPAPPAPSQKPLAERLLLKSGMKIAVLSPPKGFSLGMPTKPALTSDVDAVIVFVADRAALQARIAALKKVTDSVAVWIAYPKTTSNVPTDLTRDSGWGSLEREGFSAVRQVAIDDTWSALRFRRAVAQPTEPAPIGGRR